MTWSKTNNHARLWNRVWSVALLAVLTTMSAAAPQSRARALQKGVSVELPPTSSAAPVPDADREDALIITVTGTGRLYFGIDPVMPDALPEKVKGRLPGTQNLYIKADARARYECVVKVLDAAHAAGIADVTLLTTQPKTAPVGAVVLPEGIEMELARPSTAAAK